MILNTAGERHTLSLIALCDNSSNGCEWTGELRSLDKHMTSCGFTLLPCPNRCLKSNRLLFQLLRKDLERHVKEECPKRQYECLHCQEAGEYWERMTTHLEECPMKEVPCPKRRCNVHIARRNLAEHRQECQFEMVPCKFATIGCEEEVMRKDLREHQEDSEQHLQLAIDTVYRQQAIIREQENKLARLQSKEMPMLYKLTCYEHHKGADDEAYSPAFYTSPGGYKMCLGVYANGNGEGDGTCVSVGAYLMKGENDDHLPWPFTGKVTVELLNQLEDINHHSKTLTFRPNIQVSERVMDEERSSKSWGMPRYISHSALGYNAAKNCQYLKDDCLYFRINVDANKSSKAWLRMT